MNNSSHSRRLTSLKMYEELQLAGDFISDNNCRIKTYLLCTGKDHLFVAIITHAGGSHGNTATEL